MNAKNLPEFFKKRVDPFYERFDGVWEGHAITVPSRHPGAADVVLQSNDYLHLAKDSRIVNAQLESLARAGSGPNMSSVFQEEESAQHILERRLASFVGHDAAFVSQSGYSANLGLLPAIADETVPIYIDMVAHASLLWGARMSGGRLLRFHHNSPESLEGLVRKYGPGVVVFETVYSTNGAVCPLHDLVSIARDYGCLIVADESHSLGVFGSEGRGMVYEMGLTNDVHFITASLAKAFAGVGGFFSCPDIVDYFRFNHHPSIFSSSLEPHMISRFLKTLEIIEQEEWRRELLHQNARYLREGLDSIGYNVSESRSQIVSIEPGAEGNTLYTRQLLEQHGVFGSVFCYPATSWNRSLIRFSVSAAHKQEELDHVIETCSVLQNQLGVPDWQSTRRRHREASLAGV